MSLEPGYQVGAYEIVGPLGAGGMGSVYRARDTRLGRQVAIKFIADEHATDRTAVARMSREARLTSSLNHPNIVTVHDIGEVDGRPFIVMELVEGQSLHGRLVAGDLPLAQAVGLAAQIADGLAAAHAAGAIHRDLKPRNVMLTSSGQAKIVDFGLGKSAPVPIGANDPTSQRDITDTHAIVGTAGYMAPEQVSRRGVDFRADQFALGAILYEMLTGRRAFKRETPLQTMVSIVETEPPPLADLAPQTPPELQTIVARCLAKDPSGRYASTQDLARDLHDVQQALQPGSRSAPSHRSAKSRSVQGGVRSRRATLLWAAAVVAIAAAGVSAWMLLSRPPTGLEQARAMLDRFDVAENVEQALTVLTGYVAEHPDSAAGHALLAEAYWRKYEHTQDKSFIAQSSQAARTALKLDEKHGHTHVVLAMINLGQGRDDGAVLEARRALALDERNGLAWRELGRAFQRQKNLVEAEQAYLKAVEFNPDDWSGHNQLGALFYATKRPAEAVASFRRATEVAPDNVRALNNLGSSYYGSGKHTEAIAQYQRSLSIAPSATAAQNLGKIYYDQELYADAARAYEMSVQLPDAGAGHWRNLGAAAYWVAGLRDRAKQAYEKAVELGEKARAINGKDVASITALADSYAVLSTFADDPRAGTWREQGRAVASEATRLSLQDPGHLSTLAGAYERLGDREAALRWLKSAVDAGYPFQSVQTSPWLKELRSDARFTTMISPRKPQ